VKFSPEQEEMVSDLEKAKIVREALSIESFLSNYASQITPFGLESLKHGISENEVE
jgi:hypothetical protein